MTFCKKKPLLWPLCRPYRCQNCILWNITGYIGTLNLEVQVLKHRFNDFSYGSLLQSFPLGLQSLLHLLALKVDHYQAVQAAFFYCVSSLRKSTTVKELLSVVYLSLFSIEFNRSVFYTLLWHTWRLVNIIKAWYIK